MAHLQATSISLAYGDRDVLDNVTVALASGDRCALSGANGSGKSSLMRIMAGGLSADSGRVTASAGRISYLPQSGITHRHQTLIDEVQSAYGHIQALIEEQEELAEQLARTVSDDPTTRELLHAHHDVSEQIQRSGYYERETEISRVLLGLGFHESDYDRPTTEFSGGWQMRIALAKILLEQPDFLLLDEPTNYLDLEARVWLSSFLRDFGGGVMIVSHDRTFLDETVRSVFELFLGKIKRYRGNYSDYERQREQELSEIIKAWELQQLEIKRLEDFIRRFRATASKARQVQSRIKQLERMKLIEIPESMKRVHITFPAAPRSGKEVVTAVNLGRSYGNVRVFDGVNLLISRGERVVLVGPNGAGKSTLMRIIAGKDPEGEGTLRYGTGVVVGFYADDESVSGDGVYVSSPDLPATGEPTGVAVYDHVRAAATAQTDQQVRDLLGAFLFRGDEIQKDVGILSGGERSRLAILRLLLRPINLLVLDEPTNHLDMTSKAVLLDALRSFGGTIVFVSHDRQFIRDLAGRVVELARDSTDPAVPSKVTDYPGDYDYYVWKSSGGLGLSEISFQSVASELDSKSSGERATELPILTHEEQKALKRRVQRLDRQLHSLIDQIENSERSRDSIQQDLASPDVYSNGETMRELSSRLKMIDTTLEQLHETWDEIAAEHEKLQRQV